MRKTTALGARSERLAADYLSRAGLVVVERNVRLQAGEIDLVVRDGDETVFVEVKTRVGDAESTPDEAITEAKLARMERLAEAYLDAHDRSEAAWRVDVVAVVVNRLGRVLRIDHVRGADL